MEHVNKIVIKFLETNDLGDYVEDWLSSQTQMELTNKKSSKKEKDPNAPKRGRSAYILFSMEERYKLPSDMPAKEVMREIAQRWDDVKKNPSEMKKYTDMAQADKERCEREKSAR